MKRLVVAALAAVAVVVPTATGGAMSANRAIPASSVHTVAHASSTSNAASASSCPAMPTKAPKGYKISVKDNFNGTTLDTKRWYRWSGEPGSDPYGWWKTPKDILSKGNLVLKGSWVSSGGNPQWTNGGEVTEGIGSRHAQIYGEYQWCMRTDDMPNTSTIALLWPADGHPWPPEVDYFESNGDTTWYTTTLHFGTAKNNSFVQKNIVNEDATKWNVYTGVWKKDYLQMLENGAVVATIAFNPNVPSIPMRFDIQTQAVGSDATVGAADVGWVVEYQPTK